MIRSCATAVLVCVLVASTTESAQWLNYPTPGLPRTADGRPDLSAPPPRAEDGHSDLSGIWNLISELPHIPSGVVIESSQGPDFSLQWFRANAAPLPMTPWAEALFKERDRRFGADRPSGRCLPHSIRDAMIQANFKIVQHTGLTLILYEEFTRFRQIFTDGRPHPKDMNPAWLGYSIGNWNGDTFVVDTVGFNDRSWLDDAGHPHVEQLHTIERFRRASVGRMDVEITIDDRKAYTEPWSVTLHFGLLPDTELIEDVCDNEKDTAHSIGRSAADDEKKPVVQVPLELLAKYAGVYEIPRTPTVFEVYLMNGRLMAFGGEMTALSPTKFRDALGNYLTFVQDERGNVTHVLAQTDGFDDVRLVRRSDGPTAR